jgi:hypothetical protein
MPWGTNPDFRLKAASPPAAGDDQVFPTGGDLGGGAVHRLQARGAEAVQLHAGHGFVPVGILHDHLGHVGALLPHRGDTTHDHVVHVGRIQVVARLQGAQQAGPQVDGFYLVQAATGLSLAAGGANGIVNICGIGHSQASAQCVYSQARAMRSRAGSKKPPNSASPASLDQWRQGLKKLTAGYSFERKK